MTTFVFANYVSTTLAVAASNTATTLTLSSSANLPTLGTDEIFALTLNDTDTGLIYEIVYVTAISGVTLTVERAQEGTSAQNWNSGDIAFSGPTAGQQAGMAQVPQVQSGIFSYSADTGAVNALAITLTPAPTALADLVGAPIRVKVANTNTGASTLNVNGLGDVAIQQRGAALTGAELIGGTIAEFVYDGTAFEYLSAARGRLLNVQVFGTPGTSPYTPTPGTNAIDVLVQAAGGAGGGAYLEGAGGVSLGAPGGGGAAARSYFSESSFAGIDITVGAGGSGVNGADGNSGGTSSFGSLITCPGGAGGLVVASSTVPIGEGNTSTALPSGGNLFNIKGSNGSWTVAFSLDVGLPGSGGGGVFGTGPSASGQGANGGDATPPGAGGGGTMNPQSSAAALTGGAGANGLIIIMEYS